MLALAVLGSTEPPSAAVDDELRTGRFLVASRELLDPNFTRSVVLLLDYGPHGATGLIVNRRTEIAISSVLPDLDHAERYEGRVYFGGPVEVDGLLALLRSKRPRNDAERVIDEVWTVGDRAAVKRLLRKHEEPSLRLYAGYAGWAPGQLDGELARGSWHVVDARADQVFSASPGKLWRLLVPPDASLRASAR